MNRKLGYADEAIEDVSTLRRWLTQPGSGPAARRLLKDVRAAIEKLRHHPCLHALGEQPGVREMSCRGGYRVLYEVSLDTGRNETAGDVQILRVFGPGQNRSPR